MYYLLTSFSPSMLSGDGVVNFRLMTTGEFSGALINSPISAINQEIIAYWLTRLMGERIAVGHINVVLSPGDRAIVIIPTATQLEWVDWYFWELNIKDMGQPVDGEFGLTAGGRRIDGGKSRFYLLTAFSPSMLSEDSVVTFRLLTTGEFKRALNYRPVSAIPHEKIAYWLTRMTNKQIVVGHDDVVLSPGDRAVIVMPTAMQGEWREWRFWGLNVKERVDEN